MVYCQVQAPYSNDCVLFSVVPVPEHIALANLQPVPGEIEYAPGCTSCFYKLHSIVSSQDGKAY